MSWFFNNGEKAFYCDADGNRWAPDGSSLGGKNGDYNTDPLGNNISYNDNGTILSTTDGSQIAYYRDGNVYDNNGDLILTKEK